MFVSEEFGSPQDKINSKNPKYNVMAVRTRYTNGIKEIRKFMAKNIVTVQGNEFYAQLGARETPLPDDFDDGNSRMILQNPSGQDTPANTDNLSNVSDQLPLTTKIIEPNFPVTDNEDTNNPQSSPDTSITRKYVWGTVDFNTEGQIESFGTITPGTNYAELIATPSDAGDNNAILVATTTGGIITRVDIINPGLDYIAGDVDIGGADVGSGDDITYTVDSFGRIDGIVITSGGTLNDSPVVTVPAGGGATTIATAVATANSSGFITAVFIITGGVGYASDPTITIVNDVSGGADGTALANLSSTEDITGGAIHAKGSFPATNAPLLTHFNFTSSFEKLSTDELTVFINHQFLGV